MAALTRRLRWSIHSQPGSVNVDRHWAAPHERRSVALLTSTATAPLASLKCGSAHAHTLAAADADELICSTACVCGHARRLGSTAATQLHTKTLPRLRQVDFVAPVVNIVDGWFTRTRRPGGSATHLATLSRRPRRHLRKGYRNSNGLDVATRSTGYRRLRRDIVTVRVIRRACPTPTPR